MNLTLLAARELQRAIAQREQGVVLAAADVLAGMEVGAALADDDVAGLHSLAGELLHAQSLRVRVATVTGRAQAFLVCHERFLLNPLFGLGRTDGFDLHAGQVLTMTAQLLVVLALLELEDQRLVALELLEHSGHDLGLGGLLGVGLHLVAVYHADGLKFHLVARLDVELLDVDLVSGGDFVLLAARFHDCVHVSFSLNVTKRKAISYPTPPRESMIFSRKNPPFTEHLHI